MPKYLVTDGVNYLKKYDRNDYYLVGKEDATLWSTYREALDVMNSGLNKEHRDMFFVEKFDEECIPDKFIKSIIKADTSDFNSWLSSIGNFKRLIYTIESVKNSLCAVLGEADKELCDILHYVEFSKLNAYQGWAAAEMMKNARQKRRKIKDALYIIAEIEKGNKNGIPEQESAYTAISNLNNRKYTPRKLNYLFEGSLSVKDDQPSVP